MDITTPPAGVGDDPTTKLEVEGNGHPTQDDAPDDGSVLSQLRKVRQRLRGKHTHTLEIPGYDGLLWCRYRLLDYNELTAIAKRITKIQQLEIRELYGGADTLIAACEEFLVKDGDKPLAPLGPVFGFGEEPVRYDARLCEAFDIEVSDPPQAREVVLGLFSNALAVISHHNELATWMQDTSQSTDEEFLGESKGATRSAPPHSLAP